MGTPTLTVTDARGLTVREVAYCRQQVEQPVDTRITRQVFDPAKRLVAHWDPRLRGNAPAPNLATIFSLSEQTLSSDSVDAGWLLSLPNDAQSILCRWDSRGTWHQSEFDRLQRPVAIREELAGEPPRVIERFTYGMASHEWAAHNQCGQRVRHDDGAGSQHLNEFAVHGEILVETRQFLSSLDTPDWPLDIQLREALLEVDEAYVSTRRYTATGDPQSLSDAKGNHREFAYSVAGLLKETRLQLAGAGQEPRLLVSDIHYNAAGQIDCETAGNGVLTHVFYAADDGRPIRLVSAVPGSPPLQDLQYRYDPVGNILHLEDTAQPIVFFKNQRVEPINRYRYDSLYQLVEASGRQVMPATYGPALPALLSTPLDPNQLTHYTQTFDYDAAGNLRTRHHSGAPTFSMKTSRTSNRSLALQEVGERLDEEDIVNGFDPCGNQRQLQRGQHLRWDGRQQLVEVTMVQREDGPDDHERYIYGPRGQRLRKVRITHTGRRTLLADTRYLPGLEIHLDATHGEERHVITTDAGRSQIRMMHWAEHPPKDVMNDQLRFSLCDLLGSCTLELDENARLLNQEGFYPFGGTAWWAGHSALEAKFKVRRYSGKERDATGLYYYGHRYYAPWLQRWLSPDPAGNVDGLNRYLMVKNNPVAFFDENGLGRTSTTNPHRPLTSGRQNAEPNISYYDQHLEERFNSDSEAVKKHINFIEKNFIHQRILKYGINSSFISDNFHNIFQPDHWQFMHNFRNPTTTDYYANEMAKFQYTKIAREQNFFGHLPSLITRSNVINKETLKETKHLKSGSDKMLQTFMNKTPNGKSTQRILSDFGLMATKVEKFSSENKVSFLIHVQPVPVVSSEGNPGKFGEAAANDAPFESPKNPLPTQRRRNGLLASIQKIFR
ncbi:RHS repeat-associated core domain-containing protein [Pseudomonas synxantha]|uniref:Insecticidal toxin complex protein TccC n=1 Tax=Pseudomonas synxantha TaxID=47883 RepID=A0ACC6JS55_9PSED|nr:RHS repeat-associated core domain-containing protein [Pseudomonas synxantha]MDR6609383.1 insecticidal toxin complex protein TccC [Pseudomonas synxantha]